MHKNWLVIIMEMLCKTGILNQLIYKVKCTTKVHFIFWREASLRALAFLSILFRKCRNNWRRKRSSWRCTCPAWAGTFKTIRCQCEIPRACKRGPQNFAFYSPRTIWPSLHDAWASRTHPPSVSLKCDHQRTRQASWRIRRIRQVDEIEKSSRAQD